MKKTQPSFDGKTKALDLVDLFEAEALNHPFVEFCDARVLFSGGTVAELMVQYRLPGYPGSIYAVRSDEFRDCTNQEIVNKAYHDFQEVFLAAQAKEKAEVY
jgi:hypothetical protein